MSKTIVVKLGDTEYSVPKLNIGQLREVQKIILNDDRTVVGFAILGVALRRADPKVEDIDTVEADVDDISKAVSEILIFAGLKKDDPTPNLPGPALEAG
jgi:hypothetical protein